MATSFDNNGKHRAILQKLKKIYIYIYMLTAVGLTPGDSSTVHIYT